jgi:hypothetical protein
MSSTEGGYSKASRALAAEGWIIQSGDAQSGVIQTSYRDTNEGHPIAFGASNATRRMMLTVVVDKTSISVTPRAEICQMGNCHADTGLFPNEDAMVNSIVSSLSH